MSERVALLLIAGCAPEDTPFIVGAFNEEYLNQLPLEDADKMIYDLKETWTGDVAGHQWREIRCWVTTDDLDRAFDTPELTAEVES